MAAQIENKQPFVQFDVLPTIDGYEVVAVDTGRPVTEPRESRKSAVGAAYRLNLAAASGNLAGALRCSGGRR